MLPSNTKSLFVYATASFASWAGVFGGALSRWCRGVAGAPPGRARAAAATRAAIARSVETEDRPLLRQ